ncbi:MAG: preprotein translocase subunit SecE [Azospira oryzae]|uniref:Protein translocase subunit SecE n=1 Tax=Pelomicrobium methylotrophicum TaxID=2602750 RepID=A0A5C7EW79_9PROT|nr:preprotein translocase subunit SecE [Pelomicrobium methylotrophicum]PZP64570.1 MAG: preprotein translocase subunit SecE [Azospira oryzae]PZP82536.1 MAG: preprotein translocase subunit SecE [Azospira oryzae]TXF13206.1 preprotein translocase subunit SecE [Pelomicrobium methylotrophicum]
MADKIKLALAGLFVVAGIAGFYFLRDAILVLRVLAVLAGFGAAAAIGWFTAPGARFVQFARESIEETKKVVWPTRRETLQTTGVVLAFVVVMAIFLWLVDAGLLLVVKLLMGEGSA